MATAWGSGWHMPSRALWLCLLALGCGPGLHDLDIDTAPIATVTGRLELSVERLTALNAAPPTPLEATVVWAGPSQRSPLCDLYPEDPALLEACPASQTFVPGVAEPRVSVDPDTGEFSIPIHFLPPTSATVGDSDSRLTYGSVMVLPEWAGMGGFGGEGFIGSEQAPIFPSEVLAASFAGGPAEIRIAYREGELFDEHVFYPVPEGCADLPQGFSVLDIGAPDGEGARSCSVSSQLDVGLVVFTLEESQAFACTGSSGTFVQAPVAGLPLEAGGTCYGTDVYVVFFPGECTTMNVWSLVGCFEDLTCEDPDWDMRDDPPAEWPCD